METIPCRSLQVIRHYHIGDQSTGKSSSAESACEMQALRTAGACTRRPLEMNLVQPSGSNSQRICKIILITKYHHDSDLPERPTKGRPLELWLLQDRAGMLHFATLASRAQVARALLRAQRAISKISSDYENYTTGLSLPVSKLEVKFSPNVSQRFPEVLMYSTSASSQ